MQQIHDCILQDGTGRWQRWEELVHLLWMLLLSYNKAMKGEILVYCDGVCFPISTNTSARHGIFIYDYGICSLVKPVNSKRTYFGW